jgi:hypothetical protein
VIRIDNTLFIFNRTKKLTTGWSTIAIITAKMMGIIIPFAIYIIANNAIKPIRRMVTFA